MPQRPHPLPALPDISGMAWLSGERLLVVHDAKRGEGEGDRPRAGLLLLPTDSTEGRYLPLAVTWPASGTSHDLESVARVPGTQRVLLGESGDDDTPGARLMLAELREDRLDVLESVPWPGGIRNVEATTIVPVDGELIFVYAERNQDRDSTAIRWASTRLDPLRFGTFTEFIFATPDRPDLNRGVVALETEPSGHLLAAGSFDPDVDDGPFRSRIYRLGRFARGSDGRVRYDGQRPVHRFTVDGVKVEALAIRTMADATTELIFGSDDEDFGGIVRRLRLP